MLTWKRLTDVLHYNPDTGAFTWKVNHERAPSGSRAGYIRSDGYRYIQVDGKQYLAHRLAWFYIHKLWPEDNMDHLNRIRDDNRLANLRVANHSENAKNRSKYKNNTSGCTGVNYSYQHLGWRATITVKGKTINIGVYPSKEYAIKMRKEAEVRYGYTNG